MTYVRGSNPIWSFVDLDGNQADDTFWLWVLENEIPYQPATVYETPDGTPWTNPIQFLGNGTLPNNIYWDDSQVYRLEIRKNNGIDTPTQSDPLIYLIEDYIPTGADVTPIPELTDLTTNQITNPQFALVNFTESYTYTGTTPPDLEIAPGWFLRLTGNGTVTVTQVPLNDTLPTPTNAPYALRIELSGGWTSLPVLYQRLETNGVLWANQYVSASVTALIQGTSQSITLRLDNSDGAPIAVLANPTLTSTFVEYLGNALLPASSNPDYPPDAYIDFKILLPTTCDVYLTSLQLVASASNQNFNFEQDSVNRQIDHTFNYYKSLLQYKPIPSYLVGWDFALNPAQFGETVGPIATGNDKSFYAWDQTIVFQSDTNGIVVSRSPTEGIRLTAQAGTQAAIIQYLAQAKEILAGKVSVAIRGYCSASSQTATVSLWATADASLPNMNTGTNNSIVASLDTDGEVDARNGTWTQLSPSLPGDVQITLGTTAEEYYLSYWTDNITSPIYSTAKYFAIVIGFDEIANTASVSIDWVSLNAGEIATRPAPQTPDEVLQNCQYFYRMSYEDAADIGQPTYDGAIAVAMGSTTPYDNGGTDSSLTIGTGFTLNYCMRTNAPNITFYSPENGTADIITLVKVGQATTPEDINSNFWNQTTTSKAATYLPIQAALGTPYETLSINAYDQGSSTAVFQVVIDDRFGIT